MNGFEKIRSRFRFKKIRSRFFVAIMILSVPPLFALGFISYNIAKTTIMEINAETNRDHLQTSSDVADLSFRNAINLNRSIVLNERIRDHLRLATNATPAEHIDIKTNLASELQKMINSNFIHNRFMDSVCLLDLQFEAYCIGRSDNAGIYETTNKVADIAESQWYKDAVESHGKVLFYKDNVLGDASSTFSTVKLFRDSQDPKGEPIGILIVNISKSIFETFFTGSQSYGGEFIVLDANQPAVQVVYPTNSEHADSLGQRSIADVLSDLKSRGYLTVSFQNETTGWTFLQVVRLKELLKESNRIGTATAAIATGIALVAMILSFIVSGSITKPMLQVKKMMVDWSRGRRQFDEETFDQDEVGAIGETFKRMSAENKELNEKLIHTELREREAELRALQAQIKPHFLYNTLDSIYWMATLQKHEEAAQMTLALSQSFKLSLNKGKETILLNKELEHIHHYMTIQNIRYNNRFEYVEDIEQTMKGMEILKLLLQPLVENAIYHGLEPKVGSGCVRLTGKKDGDFFVFVVEDNGVGIEDAEAVQNGYGLRNVQERMSMYYGSSSSFLVDSAPGEGTRVELRFIPGGMRNA
ncbi:sensor histidine kinase [Paenibacillus sp. LHD-117]|uniref:cache domain-containing sensor histidine kinase n=1 Tax=Paenibacillus sp. LHD-117 TaxID=3071412 RepID=UPI0027DFCEDD|nr:sensor histidine kinase [Paenibacillus sp. LHD-117]MDQ6417987.1 sensor histidine kinase [Paenibacillus sp. LHD-117]